MTLETKHKPAPFALALFGAFSQMGTLYYFWNQTSAHKCISGPLQCISDIGAADVWGRQAVITVVIALALWAYSLTQRTDSGTSDPSIVDRLWSILPWCYVWHLFISDYLTTGELNPTLLLMAVISTMWGIRLTWNFWRKGGFDGGEDYRWAEVRKWYPGMQFEIFNLFFICLFQQLMLLAFVVPAVAVMQSDNKQLSALDLFAAGLYLTLLVGETIADLQMFDFQTEKYRLLGANTGKGMASHALLKGTRYEDGFIQSGLWGYSRHPNYFCEVAMWWAFYIFSIDATGSPINWTILGAVFLTLLFVPPGASLDTTEMLSSRKYKGYADYQKRVSRFVPWLPSGKKQA